MLDDLTIRIALRDYMSRKAIPPLATLEELRLHEGNCIADLVTVHAELHGFEIKGETDKVARLKAQAPFYNKSLPRLTLVTTPNHLKWAEKNLDNFWGILLASETPYGVRFRYARAAKRNPLCDARLALQILWRDELTELASELGIQISNQRSTRAQIADLVASIASQRTVIQGIAALVLRRATEFRYDERHM